VLPLKFQNFLKKMELKRKLNELKNQNEKIRKEEGVLLEGIFNQGECKSQ
jgi:hypothetical protein